MSEVYVLVETKKSMLRMILAYVFLFLAVACIGFTAIGAYVCVPFVFIFGVLFYFLLFKGYKEYEYSYFDGDVRFAKILDKSRRKRIKGCTMEEVVQIAPAGDRSVYNYENNKTTKFRDFTSKKKGVPYYDMVVKTDDGFIIYMLELDDKYLDAVCLKHASKVIRRQA
ncbi:MAG: DUF6106 family protein [Agathobacter sp.]|nr:DUF6106 family protein [Agathobacter sp.]